MRRLFHRCLALFRHDHAEDALDREMSLHLVDVSFGNALPFLDAVERVSRGGSVVDPLLVQELITARDVGDPLEELTPREREVLALMAEGRSNAGIARRLWIAEGTVERHVHSIMMKLTLPESDDDHRRVLAAIRFLDAHQTGSSRS